MKTHFDGHLELGTVSMIAKGSFEGAAHLDVEEAKRELLCHILIDRKLTVLRRGETNSL